MVIPAISGKPARTHILSEPTRTEIYYGQKNMEVPLTMGIRSGSADSGRRIHPPFKDKKLRCRTRRHVSFKAQFQRQCTMVAKLMGVRGMMPLNRL